MRRNFAAFVLCACLAAAPAFAQAPATTTSAPATTTTTAAAATLKANDFLAVCGDSITEQKLYSVYIENYLLMCKPAGNLRAMQFGWGGEVAPGFLGRM